MSQIHLVINILHQTLSVYQEEQCLKVFLVSTAKNGVGQLEHSGCTPLGEHIICEKIGDDLPMNAVLVGRKFTGEIYTEQLREQYPNRDWILSRILWLKGLEWGYNLGDTVEGICCDTHQRYIYIHGTPDGEPMGVPHSHGCIRMCNDDVMWLYEQVAVGTQVLIVSGLDK